MDRLFASLQSHDGMERKRAREIITLIGAPAVPRLRTLLSDPDKQVRWEAAKALGTIVAPEGLDELTALLDDPKSEVRWLAGTALIGLGTRSVVPVLKALTHLPLTRGRADQSHRVLQELARENDVLGETTGPLMDVLDRNDPAVIVPAAAQVLADLDRVTGRLP